MNEPVKVNTFRRKCIVSFTSSATILLVIALLLIGHLLFSSAEKQAIEQTSQWAKIIANRSVSYLLNKDNDSLKDSFQVLDNVDFITHIHIYQSINNNESIEFFTSYNRQSREGLSNNFYAIPSKKDHINELLQYKLHSDYVELALPIKNNTNIIGYVYIQSSLSKIYADIRQTMMLIALIALLAMLVLLMVMIRLSSAVTQPVALLAYQMTEISQRKDFSLRCPPMPLQELEWLASKINILLARVEKHISKQADAEKQIIHLNHKLEDKVNQRTEALKESNQELLSTLEKLHQYQGQLVESEKMASLGDMVAGVAHEVNTPIGLGVTASSLLSDNLAEIKTAFEDKTLKSSQLKKFLDEGQENVGIIYRNLKRAADLISSFKQVAVDQSSEESRQFNVRHLIDEVLLTLAPQLKKTPYRLDIDCPDNLVINSKPGPLNQILVNLILNSVIHGFENRDYGTISISVMHLGKQLHVGFRDDGRGVDESIKAKIFDPFITTKRGSGGSGLGLHLVYNLVTQALSGTISFDSKPGQGVRFDIDFPVSD